MVDRRDRRHRFQCRTRRIQPARRLVDQRLMVVGTQPAIFAVADPVRKAVRIKARHRDKGQDVAVGTVDDDRRARLAAHPPCDKFLQIGVDRQMDGLALHVGLGVEVADDPAARGDFDPPRPGLALQHRLKIFLQPILADFVPRRDVQRILRLLIFFGVRRPDIADQMPDRGAGRIIARKATLRGDAGHFGQADQDRRIFGLGHVFGDRDRLKPRCRLQVAVDPVHRIAVKPQQRAQLPQHQILIVQSVGNDVDAQRHAIVRQRLAMAIDDPPAPRRHQCQIDPVAFRFQHITVIIDDRDIGHARRQRDPDSGLRAAHDKRAAGEGDTPPGFGNGRIFARHLVSDYRGYRRFRRKLSNLPVSRMNSGTSSAEMMICGTTSPKTRPVAAPGWTISAASD